MYIAFDVNQTREYQLKNHQGPDEPVFILGVLDSGLTAHLNDSAFSYKRPKKDDPLEMPEMIVHNRIRSRETVRFGLKSVRNLKDKNGNQITLEFKEFSTSVGLRKGLTDASLDYFKPVIAELDDAISYDNIVTEIEAKN